MKNVTFEHIKGVEEAKQELQEVVEFLKNPQKFTMLGGKLPKARVHNSHTAGTRAHARTDDPQPAATRSPGRPKPRGRATATGGAQQALCRVRAGHKLLARLPGPPR
nr:uncharacterized protein LOC118968981 isoform X2 [Manis javanica]